jgi:acyl transferase domain-containing protein
LEVHAIARAFDTPHRAWPLHVGSVKANLGHLEGGAGIAGLVKVILMLEAQIIPPLANFEKMNPKLEGISNLNFPQKPTPWPLDSTVSRASVNSFGFGGTNAHTILEAAHRYGHDKDGKLIAKSLPFCLKPTRDYLGHGVAHCRSCGLGNAHDLITPSMTPSSPHSGRIHSGQ